MGERASWGSWVQRCLWTCALFLSLGLGGERRAHAGGFDLQFLVSLSLLGEVSLQPTQNISSQAQYPFCGIFAMSSFLELWGGQRQGVRPVPVDPAYLAVGYNREVGSGSEGTRMKWLSYIVAKYGAIPQGARFAEKVEVATWPLPNWRDNHNKLLEATAADEVLSRKYIHEEMKAPFTGADYLEEEIRVDFRRFRTFWTNHRETYRKSDEVEVPAVYRQAEKKSREESMDAALKKWGIDASEPEVSPGRLFDLTVAQLEEHHPVLVSLNPDLVLERFGSYRLIGEGDLSPTGKGLYSTHAVVAVGHCDDLKSKDPLCSRFTAAMAKQSIPECLVLQNSWGEHSHEKGYVCISRRAMARMFLRTSVLEKYVR